MRRRTEANGSVVYTLRVASDDAPVVDAALGLARTVVLDEHGRPVETPEETALAAEITSDPPAVRADADAFLLLAESFVAAGGPTGKRGDGLEIVLHADLATATRTEFSHIRRSAVAVSSGCPDGLRTGARPEVRCSGVAG